MGMGVAVAVDQSSVLTVAHRRRVMKHSWKRCRRVSAGGGAAVGGRIHRWHLLSVGNARL